MGSSLAQERREEVAWRRAPAFELSVIAEQGAIDYAKAVVRIGLLLNGGAVLALPAIASLYQGDIADIVSRLFWSGIAFVVGLILSWSAAIIAYFAMCVRQARHYVMIKIHETDVDALLPLHQASKSAGETRGDEARGEIGKQDRRYRLVRGIALCAASFIAFIIGAGISGRAFLSTSGTTASTPSAESSSS